MYLYVSYSFKVPQSHLSIGSARLSPTLRSQLALSAEKSKGAPQLQASGHHDAVPLRINVAFIVMGGGQLSGRRGPRGNLDALRLRHPGLLLGDGVGLGFVCCSRGKR